MRRLIYQVAVGKPSKLYEHCIQSVSDYCHKNHIDHIVLDQPKLWIKPDPFNSGRSEESYMKYGGYLPIYEKENAFDEMLDVIQLHLGIIDDPDEFEARFGEVTLDNIVDYIKNNSLPLPNLTPTEQLSGVAPMLPLPVQGMPRAAGEAGSSTDPPPTAAPTETPTESTM